MSFGVLSTREEARREVWKRSGADPPAQNVSLFFEVSQPCIKMCATVRDGGHDD